MTPYMLFCQMKPMPAMYVPVQPAYIFGDPVLVYTRSRGGIPTGKG